MELTTGGRAVNHFLRARGPREADVGILQSACVFGSVVWMRFSDGRKGWGGGFVRSGYKLGSAAMNAVVRRIQYPPWRTCTVACVQRYRDHLTGTKILGNHVYNTTRWVGEHQYHSWGMRCMCVVLCLIGESTYIEFEETIIHTSDR